MLGATGAAGLVTAAGRLPAARRRGGRGDRAPGAGQVGHQAHRRGDDGEPLLRPLPRLDAPERDGKQAGLTYLDRYRVPHHTHHLDVRPAAASTTPTTATRAAGSSSTAARATAGCAPGRTTASPSATTSRPTCGSSAAPSPTGRRSTATSPRSWPRPTRTASTCTAPTPTGSTTTTRVSTMPTIWDRLRAEGSTGTYYYSDLPSRPARDAHSPVDQPTRSPTFFTDAAAGTLPDVSFVDPRFIDEDSGTSQRRPSPRRHPRRRVLHEPGLRRRHAPARRGRTRVLVFTYDEWGGFFDHVAPAHGARRQQQDQPARVPRADGGRLPVRAPRLRRRTRPSTTRRSSR